MLLHLFSTGSSWLEYNQQHIDCLKMLSVQISQCRMFESAGCFLSVIRLVRLQEMGINEPLRVPN